jgi:hypothetical protein
MKKHHLLLALSLVMGTAFSQVTFVKGYIIQAKGDTVWGEVKVNTKKDFENYSKVFFKDPTGNQKFHKPEKIKGYGYEGKDYVTAKFDGENAFYWVIIPGDLMLLDIKFEMYEMNETTYKNEYYLARKGDTEFTKVKTNKFKKQLTEFMKDKPEIAAAAEDKFEIEKAIELVKQYNAAKK